nr:hypothetical protein [uncultured Desulfobacter sp.]
MEPEFSGDFEMGWEDWSADNGVWGGGTPTGGPEGCYSGDQCAGTILDDKYPSFTDSRLVSPTLALPKTVANEEIRLRFWHWFSYSNYNYPNHYDRYDKGHVQVDVFDEDTGSWPGNWQTLGSIQEYSPVWSLMSVDLTAFAGQKIRIAFYHTEGRHYNYSSVKAGWYIDDIQIIKMEPEFSGDFEMGWEDWSADNGVWGIGTPAGGPEGCYGGDQCAGTILDGKYPSFTDSRLVSPTLALPEALANEEIRLRFWHWFSYSNYNYPNHYDRYDKGHVQVDVFDEDTGSWPGNWQTLGSVQEYSPVWSLMSVDLTAFAGQKIRIAFYHTEGRHYNYSSVKAGWYVDDIQIIKIEPEFSGDFEMGWLGWLADNGVWEIGTPAGGPEGCYGGDQCAGTILGGNYPNYTDSRLVSSPIDLTECSQQVVYLQLNEWFSSPDDFGEIQISTWDFETRQWSTWNTESTSSGLSPVWTLKYVDLSAYSGKLFKIGFHHVANSSSTSHGWFVDNIELVGPEQIMPTIKSISFSSYIPDCTSLIDIFASDPCGGGLTYTWQLPDGGTLEGTEGNMEFIPPEFRVEPYRVRVAASSNSTQINSYTKTLKIFTQVVYDLDSDDDIDGSDLSTFLTNEEVNATTISRFAEEFGMIACEHYSRNL